MNSNARLPTMIHCAADVLEFARLTPTYRLELQTSVADELDVHVRPPLCLSDEAANFLKMLLGAGIHLFRDRTLKFQH